MALTAGFGRFRRARAGTQVLLTVALSAVVWGLANYAFTRPNLRTSLDYSPGARFTVSAETSQLITALRGRGEKLEIDTYLGFNSEKDIDEYIAMFADADVQKLAIYRKLLLLTVSLLERIDYLGGDKVVVRRHVLHQDIDRLQGKGPIKIDSVVFTLGKRSRSLMLVDPYFRSEFGDIELPDEGGGQAPGQSSVPILRRYSGEQAFASVLAQLLDEESLKVYWVTDRNAGRPDDPIYTDFARDLRGDGFELGLVDLDARPGEPVPEDCSLLVLLKPTAELGDQARRKLVDYFEGGGAVLLGVNFEVQEALQGLPQVTHRQLLERYGLAVGTEMVLNGIPDSTQAGGVRYDNPSCVRLLIRQGLNAKHDVTRPLSENGRFVDLVRGRPITFLEPRPEGSSSDVMLETSAQSWTEELGPRKSDFFYHPLRKGDTRPYAVAATVTLTGEPPRNRGRLGLVSGICFVNAPHGIEGFYLRNRDFALSLVNWLVRRDRLVTVRSVDYRAGRIQAPPQALDRVFWTVVVIVPAAFLLMAFGLVFWRRRA